MVGCSCRQSKQEAKHAKERESPHTTAKGGKRAVHKRENSAPLFLSNHQKKTGRFFFLPGVPGGIPSITLAMPCPVAARHLRVVHLLAQPVPEQRVTVRSRCPTLLLFVHPPTAHSFFLSSFTFLSSPNRPSFQLVSLVYPITSLFYHPLSTRKSTSTTILVRAFSFTWGLSRRKSSIANRADQ